MTSILFYNKACLSMLLLSMAKFVPELSSSTFSICVRLIHRLTIQIHSDIKITNNLDKSIRRSLYRSNAQTTLRIGQMFGGHLPKAMARFAWHFNWFDPFSSPSYTVPFKLDQPCYFWGFFRVPTFDLKKDRKMEQIVNWVASKI